MRDPDIDPRRSGEWQQSTELSVSPYNKRHGREVRRIPDSGPEKRHIKASPVQVDSWKHLTPAGKTGVQSEEAET